MLPLTQKISASLDQLLPKQTETLVVAVSGGADSLALTLLAKDYAKQRGLALEAVTVDHQLREESTTESRRVFEILNAQGIAHHTLTWEHGENLNRRHERAREARYALLIDFCKKFLNPVLLTGHHRQDQVETILMRFLKGSGPAGFRGVQGIRYQDSIPIIRPLLEIDPSDLRDFLALQNIAWIEDPSNTDSHYERTRTRQLVSYLRDLGYEEYGVLASSQKIYALHQSLENLVKGYATEFLIEDDPLTLDQVKFFNCPRQIQQEYLRQAIWRVGGGDYPKPYGTIDAVLEMLLQPKVNVYKIAGCVINVAKKKILIEHMQLGG